MDLLSGGGSPSCLLHLCSLQSGLMKPQSWPAPWAPFRGLSERKVVICVCVTGIPQSFMPSLLLLRPVWSCGHRAPFPGR